MNLASRITIIEKKQDQILRLLKSSAKAETWIHEDDVVKQHRVSKRTLKRYRAEGLIKTVRKRIKGQGVEYLKSEIEKLFILI